MSAPLRVLVVEDSVTIRKYLAGLLEREGMEVVGEAGDGHAAVALCRSLRPDAVTMDMMLPGMSGLEATEQIMAYSPTPILIVSASVNRGEAMQTLEALNAGAVDVIDKVRPGGGSAEWERSFVAAVRMAARIRVITHPRARLAVAQPAAAAAQAKQTVAPVRGGADLIALGASTGGPAALSEILQPLPADFPIPILVVLHISELFAFAFAEWLSTVTHIPARYVRDGEPLPRPGKAQILLAPAGHHLVVEQGTLRLRDTPERNSCRPSIDVLFESLAREPGLHALLCLLTGMGRDGAAGLLAGRAAGFDTAAQDESTSVIFGMPAEAIRMGGARRVLPLQDFAPLLLGCAGLEGERSGVRGDEAGQTRMHGGRNRVRVGR